MWARRLAVTLTLMRRLHRSRWAAAALLAGLTVTLVAAACSSSIDSGETSGLGGGGSTTDTAAATIVSVGTGATSSPSSSQSSSSPSSSSSGSGACSEQPDCQGCCERENPDGYSVLVTEIVKECGCASDGDCYASCGNDPVCSGGLPGNACVTCLNGMTSSNPCAIQAATGPECSGDPDCAALIDCILGC
jgi:hypothetical protein